MKTFRPFVKIVVFIVTSLFFISSCSDDDHMDTSLLVGAWDSRSILEYENEEWIDRSEFPSFIFLIFDGKNFNWGGPVILMLGDVKQAYSYDAAKQVITLSDGTIMQVLKLTDSELEIEEVFKNEKRSILRRSTYERRVE